MTVQLLEMGVPIVLALNMMDVARKRGLSVDTDRLAAEPGCPVVPVMATTKEGMTELTARAMAVARGRERGGFALAHEECVEQAVAELAPRLDEQGNSAMRSIGLPGKAFMPLIVGVFGCNLPTVMATRTLENQRERKLTFLMNPFMSCGAGLPAYVLSTDTRSAPRPGSSACC